MKWVQEFYEAWAYWAGSYHYLLVNEFSKTLSLHYLCNSTTYRTSLWMISYLFCQFVRVSLPQVHKSQLWKEKSKPFTMKLFLKKSCRSFKQNQAKEVNFYWRHELNIKSECHRSVDVVYVIWLIWNIILKTLMYYKLTNHM